LALRDTQADVLKDKLLLEPETVAVISANIGRDEEFIGHVFEARYDLFDRFNFCQP
jgi:hypothetical protein